MFGVIDMARRYSDYSDSPRRTAKKPLLYRISPVDKLLDDIDSQEKELSQYWEAGKIEDDTYFRLVGVLQLKRERAEKRLRKEAGLPPLDEEDVVQISHKKCASDVLIEIVDSINMWAMKNKAGLTKLAFIAVAFYIIF